LKNIPSWFLNKLRIPKILKKKFGYTKGIFFIDHHLSHAASFFMSGFDKAVILNVDGVGEFVTTSWGIGDGNNIKLLGGINFPHSLGLFYSTITSYLGFSVNNSEYKVMGLAAYGDGNRETNIYYEKLKKVIRVKEDGSFRLDMSYFDFCFGNMMFSKKMEKLLGVARGNAEKITKRYKDISAALQMIYEEIIFGMLNNLHRETGYANLILSGGCALNSVCNGKILENTGFEKIWIHPDSGDGGASIGAAAFAWNVILNEKKKFKFENVFIGPGISPEIIRNFLDKNKIYYEEFEDEVLVEKVADLIYKNNVIGWFQGRMEFGPRALGNRSILANPCNKKMKDILNLKIKKRENFRPFAPVVCEDDFVDFFLCDDGYRDLNKFMLAVCPVKKNKMKDIPSVIHVDGTVRVQSVSKKQNPLYYSLIKEFGKISGNPILINTSFNIRGEPIVCSLEDALSCMVRSGIDYVVFGNFLVKNVKEEYEIK
jgi:carbamoyltransferase